MLGERVEPLVEEDGKLVDPAEHLLQGPWTELVDPPAPLAALGDEVGLLEHFEVLRNGRKGDAERFGELAGGLLSFPQRGEDRASRGMGDGVEHVVPLQGPHHFVQAGYSRRSAANRACQSGRGRWSSWASSLSRKACV